jgi:7,8-dihydropterin-6-yl-methyl-4-(beta-D-ribofuranosyl)aminobenzene 5'-phosphate synthase
LAVILGCAHAGVLNILAQAAADFQKPISTVVGGMHLHGAEKPQIDRVAAVLTDVYGAPWVYPNHCTGMAGLLGLRERLGDRVKPFPVGTTLEF